MKQEDKELIFKELCARLPYHVKCKIWLEDGTTEEGLLDLQHNYGNVLQDAFYYNKIKDIKPYLRPMSSITDEEKIELQKAFNIKSSIIGEYGISSNNAWWVKDRREPLGFDTIRYTSFCGVTNYLNSIHVDYRGLIEKGLAIKVTKENNPYEIRSRG